jgi:hypothetical protein
MDNAISRLFCAGKGILFRLDCKLRNLTCTGECTGEPGPDSVKHRKDTACISLAKWTITLLSMSQSGKAGGFFFFRRLLRLPQVPNKLSINQ